ncbi:hypothetical protein C8A05DRAFT_31738 [Staphylotrichum tortipilum]|uniref:Heterokaryon incompatibility domain-containing protein n=1 Tax=Staphylotrichum tortipilum TaxID=2831512 RepID=A0AAN6RWA0_9PEZI|nr:hypothetical protein C8A05DRAFT_31738 [Staphylotrichum longicolle]
MRDPPHFTELCDQCKEISESGRGSKNSYELFGDKQPWASDCYGCWIFEGLAKATAKVRQKERVETVSLNVLDARRFRIVFKNDVDWDEYFVYNGLDIIDEESALSYGRSRLSSCKNLHTKTCALPYGDPTLPTRVVCVGNDNDGVFLAAQDPDSYYPTAARYACLGHCWGDSQPLRTLKSNLKAHLENIPWQQIPKTFQDAISYTHKLGDDADDWLAESAKMADIYQNAYVTLAASAGRGSSDGLYHTPGNSHIPFGTIHDCPVGVGLRRPPKHPIYRSVRGERAEDANADFPLFTRAWVFQERMLSSRIIHFGPHEMF